MSAKTTAATHTYMRDAVPAEKVGQCPCCLRNHRSTARTTLVRHGWTETGRQVGQYGCGYQWGNCNGTGKRPLEQTDADAIVVLVGLEASLADTKRGIEIHTKGADSYVTTRTIPTEHERNEEARVAKVARYEGALTAHGLAFESKATEERKQSFRVYYTKAQTFTFTVLRGAKAVAVLNREVETNTLSYDKDAVALQVPSYEALRKSAVLDLEQLVTALERQRAAIKLAIKHHHDNPSNGQKDTKRRGNLVHLSQTIVRPNNPGYEPRTEEQRTIRRLACGKRANTMGGYVHLSQTETLAEVTCEKCKKAAGK